MSRAIWILLAATGCGRIGFDANVDTFDSAAPCVPTPVTNGPVFESLASGDLQIAAGETFHDELMSVPLGRTIQFTSIRQIEQSPTHGGTQCALQADRLRCKRTTAGTDFAASNGVIDVHWTTVTFSSGVTVQRGEASTQTVNPNPKPLTAVPLDSSFIVLTGISSNVGTGWGDNEFVRARLVDPTTIELGTAASGETIGFQVVTMEGAVVERGLAGLESGADLTTIASGTLDNRRAFPLVSYAVSGAQFDAGAVLVRADLRGTALDLRREFTGPAIDASWEVIAPPFAVTNGVTTLAPGVASVAVPIDDLSETTAIAFASNQSLTAQSGGSTTYQVADVLSRDLVGDGLVTLRPTPGNLEIARVSTTGAATINWTVIDVSKPPCL